MTRYKLVRAKRCQYGNLERQSRNFAPKIWKVYHHGTLEAIGGLTNLVFLEARERW